MSDKWREARLGTAMAMAIAMAAMPMLGACSGAGGDAGNEAVTGDAGDGAPVDGDVGTGGDAGQGSQDSLPAGRATTDTDRNWWTSVADDSGRIVANVIDVTPHAGNTLDDDALLRWLADADGIRWSHVVIGDNMATHETEHAYLHLSRDSDARQVASAAARIDKERDWDAEAMTVDGYQSYLDGVDETGMSYYETTYLGNVEK